MLLTGDAEAEAVPMDPGPIDVLKVAHHGSEDAGLGELLDRSVPKLAVISVGAGNSYGHPTGATLSKFRAHDVPTMRTDRTARSTSTRTVPGGRWVPTAVSLGDGLHRPQHRTSPLSVQRTDLLAARVTTRPRLAPMPEPEMKPAYLIAGTDEAKISRARGRLRERAEREGGPGALELFEAGEGRRSPDVDAVVSSLAAISLIASRRYLLVDGVDGWGKADAERATEALAQIPPETTLALVAHGKAPTGIAKAVEKAGGEVLAFDVPRERELPKQLVADARRARLRPGADGSAAAGRATRAPADAPPHGAGASRALGRERAGRSACEDLEAMVSDTSEEAIWTLADAVVAGDEAETMRVGGAARRPGRGAAKDRLLACSAAAPGAQGGD